MATLSEKPTDWQLEDFLAAHLASRGLYVEMGVTERERDDILELDVVGTDYSSHPASVRPFEVKSGKWGLTDVFKFQGWMTYLDLSGGVLLHTVGASKPEALARVTGKLGLKTIHVSDSKNEHELSLQFAGLGLRQPLAQYLPSLWRFSFWAQRRLFTAIQASLRLKRAMVSGETAKEYYRLINDTVFFEPDIRVRVKRLLEAHKGHPRLARTMAHEMCGRPADLQSPVDCAEFRSVLHKGTFLPVQACLHIGHRARLYVLKALIDYADALQSGRVTTETWRIGNIEIDITHSALYGAFRTAMDQLSRNPSFRHYPRLWQTLLWSWGGFLLRDRRQAEMVALGRESGVPAEEVPLPLPRLTSCSRLTGAGGSFLAISNLSSRCLRRCAASGRRGAFKCTARMSMASSAFPALAPTILRFAITRPSGFSTVVTTN